jgi:hypothetical protein
MNLRKTLALALCAGCFGAVPLASSAEVAIYLNTPPPMARYEKVPAPREGYVWSGGYWDKKGDRHTWRKGHWEQRRSGFHFTQPTWTQRDNRWELQRGRWNAGDRDGDGVPNRVDRAPDNPRRN